MFSVRLIGCTQPILVSITVAVTHGQARVIPHLSARGHFFLQKLGGLCVPPVSSCPCPHVRLTLPPTLEEKGFLTSLQSRLFSFLLMVAVVSHCSWGRVAAAPCSACLFHLLLSTPHAYKRAHTPSSHRPFGRFLPMYPPCFTEGVPPIAAPSPRLCFLESWFLSSPHD